MRDDRRVRIVATLGPASDRPGVLTDMIRAGLDVARLNFSHGNADEHKRRAAELRTAAAEQNRNVAILADLPGPKLRVIISSAMPLTAGGQIVLAANPASPDEIGVTEPECLDGIKPGHRVLLDDGRLSFRVDEVQPGRVLTTVITGGLLQPKKGINLPDSALDIPAITERDRAALAIAAAVQVDWLALSFVRSPEAADDLRRAAADVGLNVPVLAKIERPEAVARIARIVAAFDAIMVARGDLGVEIPLERVPIVQKHLIAEARAQGKPVITATDMLDSMRTNPRPTRAEASDVANAIYDGTDAVMLSGETAVGAYPVEAIACMDRIARQAEADLTDRQSSVTLNPTLEDDIAAAVCALADSVAAEAIIVPTLSGRTARLIARHRPKAQIIAPVPRSEIRCQLALTWGVRPVPLDEDLPAGADRLAAAVKAAVGAGLITQGQRVVVIAGHPVEGGPELPTLRLVHVAENGNQVTPGE